VNRVLAAAADPAVMVNVDGPLAMFNDAGVLGPLDIRAAATIGRLNGESRFDLLLAAALAVRGTRFGHVCIRPESVRQAVVVDGQDPETIDALPWPDPGRWLDRLPTSPLVGDGSGSEPLVLEDGRLYLERYHRYERLVARLISERCQEPPREIAADVDAALRRLLGDTPADGQLTAGRLALTGAVAVIAGGPGTGKTHTVSAVLAALAGQGADMSRVALCAPTGKAAARLGEALDAMGGSLADQRTTAALSRVAPSTIHRLLGWRRGRGVFLHDETNPLPHHIVVVDEMSMVSLPLAAKLLAAVRPEAAVVLVGDPFQLESIEAGTVLGDIVGQPAALPVRPPIAERVVVLERMRRFEKGGVIARFAEAVRRGDPDGSVEMLTAGHDELRWVEHRSDPAFAELWGTVVEHRASLVRTCGEVGNERTALTALTGLAVLCARRQGPDSVSRWRRDIEAELDMRFTGLRYGGEWYPGRPVMITSNDYHLDLYNGDIGVTVQTDDGLRVVFDRSGIREFPLTHLGEHATVHAMTIHKSQGSQFDGVVVVLPDEASRLLTRELLYTAVTRARSKVWVVGSREVVAGAVHRSVERASGLGVRLWGRAAPGVGP
jgi:exodeoxyribonuclease V alpha subunit